MSDQVNRVFLWCVPRTVSTALTKCLSFIDGLRVVNEAYASAFYMGPERVMLEHDPDTPIARRMDVVTGHTHSAEATPGYPDENYSYAWIRDELLGGPCEDKNIVLCKDMAFYLRAKYHMLPSDFRHSFLIRHPAKVFPSWKTSLMATLGDEHANDLGQLPEYVFPPGYGFKELYELMVYVEMNLGQKPVVLDMDDLLADPPGILPAYCREMGIPYGPQLLSWEAGDDVADSWIMSNGLRHANKVGGFFDEALMSTGFKRPKPPPAIDSLPADVRSCAEASQWYYEQMRERRIKAAS